MWKTDLGLSSGLPFISCVAVGLTNLSKAALSHLEAIDENPRPTEWQ